jgi:Flp pilus assembly protein CpaB
VENIMSSKLFTTRQGTILLGVIAAVIAAIALLVYLNHYRDSVNANNARIRVLVAKSLIQAGTSGDVIAKTTGMYEVAQIPKKQVQTGAIVDPSTLAGTVALKDINPNSQLTTADFGPGAGLATQLAANQRAVVISLGSPQEVGGQIAAGSHVDVWITSNGQSSNGVTRPVAKLLYQDMYVLNAGTNGGNVTLRGTSKQAGTIIYASQNSQIWLVLRPTVATNTKPPVIGASNLIGH